MQPYELMDFNFQIAIPETVQLLQEVVKPNLPWAEDHFQERVGGAPLNPPPSEAWWPYAVKGNEAHKANEQFSHTYPERFWPRFANEEGARPNGRQVYVPHNGIRYEYGDLNDVIKLLKREPTTRQAFLPVWFPEDTGAAYGQRVPCTLGYQFNIREGFLYITYFIRSCDYMRHFRDDVYMACRLAQWISPVVNAVPVRLTMHIVSFHIFEGDRAALQQRVNLANKAKNDRLLTGWY